jgi:hypothetical protein
VLTFFAALTAGRLVMIPPKLNCAGSCGLSFERSGMIPPASCLRRSERGVNQHLGGVVFEHVEGQIGRKIISMAH